MLTAIGTGVTSCIGYLGDVISSITTTSGDLAPLLEVIGLSIGLSLIGWAIVKIKSVTYGF